MIYQIVDCNAAQNCSGQGICGPDGACKCDVGFYTEDCSSKFKIWYCVLNAVLPSNYVKSFDQEKLLWIWGWRLKIDSQDQFIQTGKGQNDFWNRVLVFFITVGEYTSYKR